MTKSLEHARTLYASGDFSAAQRIIIEALATNPQGPDLWNLLGAIQRAQGKSVNAARSFSRAITYASGSTSGVWANLGNAHLDLRQPETAVACYRQAVSLTPRDPSLHHDLGVALMWANRPREAADAFSAALGLNPGHAPSRLSRAQASLSVAEFEHGWTDYEARIEMASLKRPDLVGERWQGQQYQGKRLIVLSEQGHGDAIWAARYLGQVKTLGGELIVECQSGLVPIFSSLGVVDRIITKGSSIPDADFHCYICSLPGLFTRTLCGIPNTPYIRTEWPDSVGKFQNLCSDADRQLRVGIIWSGSVTFAANSVRALSLRMLLRAISMPGVQLFSLQKGPPQSDLAKIADHDITDFGDLLGDFSDTASAISRLDLVIMIDSSVAHLCGAMGKPVWVLLNSPSYWLWMQDRTDSPWYPSMRLFRAKQFGEWSGVLDQIATELIRLVLSRSHSAHGMRECETVRDSNS
jgi:tetratricopeptide repeat protein